MATLRIRLYRSPADELGRLNPGPVRPRWVERVMWSRGTTGDRPTASALVEALAEGLERRLASIALLLRKAEARGWTVELREDGVLVSSGLALDAARAALQEDGVWHLVRRLADAGEAQIV